MAKPVMAMAMGISVKRKRCLVLSEMYAINIAKPKAAAQGGTLCSLFVPVSLHHQALKKTFFRDLTACRLRSSRRTL